MGVHEECGVFGVFAPAPDDVASMTFCGLFALQHRGQESCGIVVNDDGVFASRKDLGLVGRCSPPRFSPACPRARWRWGMCAMGPRARAFGPTANRSR